MMMRKRFIYDNDGNIDNILDFCKGLGLDDSYVAQIGYDAGVPQLYNKYIDEYLYNENTKLYCDDANILFWRSTTNIIAHMKKNSKESYVRFASGLLESKSIFEDIITYSYDPLSFINTIMDEISIKYSHPLCKELYPWIYMFRKGYLQEDEIIGQEYILYSGLGYLLRCHRHKNYNKDIIINFARALYDINKSQYKIFCMYLVEIPTIDIGLLINLDGDVFIHITEELSKVSTYRYCNLYKRLINCDDARKDAVNRVFRIFKSNMKRDLCKYIYVNLVIGEFDELNKVLSRLSRLHKF